jgi:hypothetical protein
MAASATLASFAPELLLTGPLPARGVEEGHELSVRALVREQSGYG